MFKRFGLWAMMSIAIVGTIGVVTSVLGIGPYLTSNGIAFQELIIMCALWGMLGSFISLAMSKFIAKKMMGVKIIDEDNSQYGKIVLMVHRLARSADLNKMPELGIYESPEVNAFATGPSKSNSLVAVSTGLLQSMNSDELEGVLAHEVAHIANGDMVTMTLIQGVVNAFVMFFARIVAYAVTQMMRSDDDESPIGGFAYYGIVFVFDILFGILGSMITAWFSRVREYSADLGGAQLAGKDKMLSALKKLNIQYEHGQFDKDSNDSSIAAFKISSKETGFRALISTHPKLSDRISRLENLSY